MCRKSNGQFMNCKGHYMDNLSGLQRMGGKSFEDFAYLVKRGTGRRRGRVSHVSIRLGQKDLACPAWMLPTDKLLLPKQPHIAFPKPPKGPGWFVDDKLLVLWYLLVVLLLPHAERL